MAVVNQHFAWPFQVGADGQILKVEQDSDADVAGCMAAVLSWPLGTRWDDLDFGVQELAFSETEPDVEAIRQALQLSEPRAQAVVNVDSDEALHGFAAQVRVGFQQDTQDP